MFKVELKGNSVAMEVSGTTMDITADVCRIIQITRDKLAQSCKSNGEMFIECVKKFVNEWDFDCSDEENLKRSQEEVSESMKKEKKSKMLEELLNNLDDLSEATEMLKQLVKKKQEQPQKSGKDGKSKR